MSRIVSPKQFRINDPYQQRILQFDTNDSRVYLSRVSNYLLKSIGNDAVIKGFNITNINVSNDNIFSCTISPGLLIQDSTLIEVVESFDLNLDISGFDSCNGYLVLYTAYQYIYSIEENHIRFKLSYITKDGLTMSPIVDSWNENGNRIYLNLYSFDKEYNIKEIERPRFFYINSKKYYKRGKLNFIPVDDSTSTIDPHYYNIPHDFNTYKIFSQIYDENDTQRYINDLKLTNTNIVSISIDEYKDFDNYYKLVLYDYDDIDSFEVLKSNLTSNKQYLLNHNYNQQYIQIQVFNEFYELVNPRSILFTNSNSLVIDFTNLYDEENCDKFYVLLNKHIITKEITSSQFNTDLILVEHNFNKFHVGVQLVNKTNGLLISEQAIILNNIQSVYIDTTICNLPPDDYVVMFYKNTKILYHLYNDGSYVIPYHVFTKQISGGDLVDNQITIEHKLSNTYPIVHFYDQDKYLVQPNSIHIDDTENITIGFIPNSLNETLTCIVFGYFDDNVYIISESETGLYTLDLTNQVYQEPIFQIYNSDNYLVIPDQIIKNNSIYTFIFNESIGELKVIVAIGFNNFNSSFYLTEPVEENSLVSIEHNLSTMYPIVQLYSNNEIIYPNNIQIISSNEIHLDLPATNDLYEINIISGILRQPIYYKTNNSYIQEFNSLDLDQNNLIVTHNLLTQHLIIQVYNNENQLIYPQTIKILNNNQIEIDLTSITVLDFFKIVILKVSL